MRYRHDDSVFIFLLSLSLSLSLVLICLFCIFLGLMFDLRIFHSLSVSPRLSLADSLSPSLAAGASTGPHLDMCILHALGIQDYLWKKDQKDFWGSRGAPPMSGYSEFPSTHEFVSAPGCGGSDLRLDFFLERRQPKATAALGK